jgi:hypothetical protein
VTQVQLESAVADALGESLPIVRRLGFGAPAGDLEPEDIRLVIDCPFCGRAAAYPGPAHAGSAPLCECEPCDVEFEFGPGEVYVAGVGDRLRAYAAP